MYRSYDPHTEYFNSFTGAVFLSICRLSSINRHDFFITSNACIPSRALLRDDHDLYGT